MLGTLVLWHLLLTGWLAPIAVANILTLPENEEVLVVGTVYKDMKLKPSILDEYVKVGTQLTIAEDFSTSLSTQVSVLHRTEGLRSWLVGPNLLGLMTASFWRMRVHA